MIKVVEKQIDKIVFNQKGDKTHVGGLINGSWYSFGLFTDRANFPLKEEQIVSFSYAEGDRFGVVDLKTVLVKQLKPPYNKGGGYKKDNSGLETGHCVNGAMLFLKYRPNSYEELVNTACKVHDITVNIKEWYKEQHPEMSEYNVGAASGHSVLTALKLVDNLDEVEHKAKELLTDVIPVIMKHVRGE